MLRAGSFLLPISLLVACEPGFIASGNKPPQPSTDGGQDLPSSGGRTIDIRLINGMKADGSNQNTLNAAQIQINGSGTPDCPSEIAARGMLTATSAEQCDKKTGMHRVSCRYQFDPSIIADPAVKAGKNFALTYKENKLLPFYAEDKSGNYDVIQSWAAVAVHYADGTMDNIVSAEPFYGKGRTATVADRMLMLKQSPDKILYISLTVFLSCTSYKSEMLSTMCGFGCSLNTTPTANSNKLLSLPMSEIFTWQVSGLSLKIAP